MKKFISLFSLILIAGFAASAVTLTASKSNSTRKYAVDPFDELAVSSSVQVIYEQSNDNTYSVVVTAPDNIIDYVTVKTGRNKVSIGLKSGLTINGGAKIETKVVAPILTEVKITGASSLKTSSLQIPGRKFSADISGASSLSISKLNALSCDIDVSGASNLSAPDLKANKIELEVSGSSNAGVGKLDAKEVEIDASGASHVKASGKTYLVDLDASGTSVIDAKGLRAETGEVEASGVSKVDCTIKTITSRKAYSQSIINVSNP